MIIDCPYCESKVDAILKSEIIVPDEDSAFPIRFSFLLCPVCKTPLLANQIEIQTGPDEYRWGEVQRLWPLPDERLDKTIPDIVAKSIIEAKKCFQAKAYSATVVMCGRALEGVCKQYGTKSQMLAGGLKELLEKKIIDERLFLWGEELRKHRNIGAHATEEEISMVDAEDLLDFVTAICDYVFVLTIRFINFMNRQQKVVK